MDNLVFSEKNIEHLIKSSNLDTGKLIDQFTRKNLISHARYIDCAGLPWGSWKKVVRLIDKYLLDENWIYTRKEDNIFNNNISYFAPSSFIKLNLVDFIDILNSFNQQQINQTLSQEIVVKFIHSIITMDLNQIILKDINENLFINILLCLNNKDYFNKSQEIEIIKIFIELKKSNLKEFTRNLLLKRLDSLVDSVNIKDKSSDKTVSKDLESKKIALIISGQLRGFEKSIPRFCSKFENLKNIDAYISTWEDVGYTRFNLQSAYRVFDEETCKYIYENKSNLNLKGFDSKISNYTKKIFSKNSINEFFNENLTWCNNINLNIKDHTEYPYNSMNNSEKMYFHNSYWLETLGEEHFSEYDLIIKIRPDYYFKDLNPILEINNIIESQKYLLSDTSEYLFQEWGFGMGDQFWIGKPNSILPILKCHSRYSTSYKYMQYFYPQDTYQGHINCGIEAWVHGLSLLETPSSMLKSKLASIRLISFDEFKDMELQSK